MQFGGVVAQFDPRCFNPEFPSNPDPIIEKCNDKKYYIDPKAKTTYIIDSKLGTPAKFSNLKQAAFAYRDFLVNTDLVIDQGASFYHCRFLVAEGVQIKVNTGVRASFAFCDLYSCQKMWKGILLSARSRLAFDYNTIQDAQYAIHATEISTLYVNNNTFDRNYIGIYLEKTKPALSFISGGAPRLLSFQLNKFKSTSTVNEPYAGQLPVPTKVIGFAGLKAKNMTLVIPSREEAKMNEFEKTGIGILAMNATLDISKNCRFTEHSFGGVGLHVDDIESFLGFGIIAYDSKIMFDGNNENSSFTNNLLGGIHTVESSLSLKNTTFIFNAQFNLVGPEPSMGTWGVWSENYTRTTTQDVSKCFFSNFNKNVVYDSFYPLDISAGTCSSVNITDNVFTSFDGGNQIGVGYYQSNQVMKINNNVFRIKCQRNRGGAIGVGDSRNFQIIKNSIGIDDKSGGIGVGYCNDGRVENNTITGVSPIGSNDPFFGLIGNCGIYTVKAEKVRYCTNKINNTFDGMVFISQNPQTLLGENSFNNHTVGLRLGNSGSAVVPLIDFQDRRDNTWVAGANINNDAAMFKGDVTLNKFFIEASKNTYPFFPLVVQPAKWFKNSDSDLPNPCASSKPSGKEVLDFSHQVLTEDWFEEFSEVEKWEARHYQYQRLMEGEIGIIDPLVADYYKKYKNTDIGQLERLHYKWRKAYQLTDADAEKLDNYNSKKQTYIDAISQLCAEQINNAEWTQAALDMYDYRLEQINEVQVEIDAIQANYQANLKSTLKTLQSENNEIEAKTDYVQDEIILNNLELKRALANNALFTDAELEQINNIAVKCKKQFGSNVDRAIRLLPECKRPTTEGKCFDDDNGLTYPKGQSSIKQVSVYPNPSNEILSFTSNITQQSTLVFVNNLGEVLKTIDLDTGNYTREIPVADLPNGIYSIQIRSNEQVLYGQKVVIQH